MKTLIAYSSKTGNTKKVGEAISKVILNSDIMDLNKVKDVNNYDLIIVGTWIDKGSADSNALNFIKKIEDKKVAYFFTLGAYPGSKHATDCIENINNLFYENNNSIIGNFHCQGAIDPTLISWMEKLPKEHPHSPNPERLKRWKDASFHPNEEDFINAQEVFKNIISSI